MSKNNTSRKGIERVVRYVYEQVAEKIAEDELRQSLIEKKIDAARKKRGLVRLPDGTITRPAYARLKLRESNTGDIAELDGVQHRLSGEKSLRFLQRLQEAKGEPIKGIILQSELNERPSRIHKRLPKPIQAIVEKPGRGSSGYRMF